MKKQAQVVFRHIKRAWPLIAAGFFLVTLSALYLLNRDTTSVKNISSDNDYDRHFVDHRLATLFRTNRTNLQTIVLWTEWFGDPDWKEFWAVGDQLVSIENEKTCFLTTSRRYLPRASAVVFHARDFKFSQLPHFRFPWQRWVFYLLESPVHSRFEARHWIVADHLGFNWTMGYRSSNDIYAPYIHVAKRTSQDLTLNADFQLKHIHALARNFTAKKKMAIWLSNNCDRFGHRESLIKKLVTVGVEVDIAGSCGPDDRWRPGDDDPVFGDYRFYFAFENSICDDYATEKAMRGLMLSQRFGVIPVVFGGANYSHLLPSGSYIDATAGEIKALSEVLLTLSATNDSVLIEPYFAWQYWKRIDDDSRNEDVGGNKLQTVGAANLLLKRHLMRGMEQLCRKLWREDKRHCGKNTRLNYLRPHPNSTCNVQSSVKSLKSAFGNCKF